MYKKTHCTEVRSNEGYTRVRRTQPTTITITTPTEIIHNTRRRIWCVCVYYEFYGIFITSLLNRKKKETKERRPKNRKPRQKFVSVILRWFLVFLMVKTDYYVLCAPLCVVFCVLWSR